MKKALFLDRDGIINVELNYLYKIEDFKFIDGIFELCRHYQSLGYLIIVVTNQSGIVRGYYSEADFEKLTSWMINEFAKDGIKITKVYHCPHHPELSGACSCRKPEPGMILEAKKEFDIDLENSILVGDKERDIEAAIAAGIKKSYLFDETGLHKTSKATKTVSKLKDIYYVDTK
ncbi:D-glycero-beta-D-manno-heptose 1,7-bisphosphate 7-phosphatase [Sulfurimonas sp. CVO]|jgi:D-glycero-D-manno-heptose 1,7-bisphosphate phosphatase|uniref:D-glycero-beta-D-manno-heptose 1,7-bisphosphate 7-phosphatase n=1 Tax=Sulfurimonas sp. CVO TaxID=2283483 RepID=UPI00132F020A|nr:D-glycero-beta-D-manno-heptose 1,7-bisphosphate 7-phosphatase [Sulfurimonas sp. CVO]QHG92162.1 D-glycero-beta-D-manno-heptose 1,7-bisphosphate 7-phosphatase [Sulfurimonas sp. CVO]